MTFLRTAIVLTLLNLTIHAQGKNPDAADASAAIVPGGVAIYAMLTNPTMYDAFVQSGTSDAGRIELRDEHNKTTNNLTIPSFGSLELKAGGPLVLVSELKGQPKAGETKNLKLMTAGGVATAIAAVVK